MHSDRRGRLELYEAFLRLHILPTLGPLPLGRLTAGIRSWHAGLLAEGPGASSVAKCYRLLRTILNTGGGGRPHRRQPVRDQGSGRRTG